METQVDGMNLYASKEWNDLQSSGGIAALWSVLTWPDAQIDLWGFDSIHGIYDNAYWNTTGMTMWSPDDIDDIHSSMTRLLSKYPQIQVQPFLS